MKQEIEQAKQVYEVEKFEETKPAVSPATVYLSSLGSENSRAVQYQSLKAIAILLGNESVENTPWHKIRYRHAVAIRSVFIEKYSPASGNRMLYALKGVVKSCLRMKLMSRRDAEDIMDVRPIRGSRESKGRMLSKEELRKIYDACSGNTDMDVRNYAILTCGHYAGMRRSEICKLRLEDVNFASKFIRIIGKGNKQRDIYVSEKAIAAIKRWAVRRGAWKGPMFYDFRNKSRPPMVPQAIFLILRQISKKAGIPDFSPHDLRRTFASSMLEAGVDLSTVQQLMGHESPTTTSRYDLRGSKAKEKAAAILSASLEEE